VDSTMEAVERLDEVKRRAEERPDSAAAQYNLGLALGRRGLVDRAEKAYRRALELDPDLVEAWVNLGGVLLLKWDFKGCLEANREAIRRRDDLLAAPEARQALGAAMALGHRPSPEFLRALDRAEQEIANKPTGEPARREPEST
jgi:tetratricopeptide (TPR) repeat protein